tara:strand:- start:40 stop:225 length:186 start_codon:yes stop_codon:yes gene_type:complete
MAYPTNPKYKLIKSSMDDTKIDRVETMDGDYRIVFLMVDGNRHYEEYKKWVSLGNTPEEAD